MEFYEKLEMATPAYCEVSLCDCVDLMNHAYFNLAKQIRTTDIVHVIPDKEKGEVTFIEIHSDHKWGIANIWEFDIILFAISHFAYAMNKDDLLVNMIRTSPTFLSRSIHWQTSGITTPRLITALTRLHNTYVQITKVNRNKQLIHEPIVSALIDEMAYDKGSKQLFFSIHPYLFEKISKKKLLALPPEYFNLTSSHERQLYRIARKSAGAQKTGRWMSFKQLYTLFASTNRLGDFLYNLKKIIERNNLPEYSLSTEDKEGEMGILFIRRDMLTQEDPNHLLSINYRTKITGKPKRKKSFTPLQSKIYI